MRSRSASAAATRGSHSAGRSVAAAGRPAGSTSSTRQSVSKARAAAGSPLAARSKSAPAGGRIRARQRPSSASRSISSGAGAGSSIRSATRAVTSDFSRQCGQVATNCSSWPSSRAETASSRRSRSPADRFNISSGVGRSQSPIFMINRERMWLACSAGVASPASAIAASSYPVGSRNTKKRCQTPFFWSPRRSSTVKERIIKD